VRDRLDLENIPNVILFERRRQPDPRQEARGGRKASDSTGRSLGAWPELERRWLMWHQWLGKLSPRGSGDV